jgi:membrane-associated phospholipid phosphatase
MASREPGVLENVPERSLATNRPPRDAGGSPPRSIREQVFRIVAVTLTCAVLVAVSVALIDRPVAMWVHEHLGDQRFGWFTGIYDGHLLRLGPFSLMASPAQALRPLAAFAFVVLAIAALSGFAAESLWLCVCQLSPPTRSIPSSKACLDALGQKAGGGDNPSWISKGVFGFFPFHGGLARASFPSGHTTIITATAGVLWVILPELRVAWAALVGVVVGLIAWNCHFVSYVIAGLHLGAGIGLGVAVLMVSPDDRIN